MSATPVVVAATDSLLAPQPATVASSRAFPSVLPLNGEGRVAWTVTNPPAVSPLLNGIAATPRWTPDDDYFSSLL